MAIKGVSMTVEQLAKQYTINNYELIEEGQRTDEKARKQAFIAGYAEAQNTIIQCNRSALSGVKWHKVADGDLPKECKMVLVYTKEFGIDLDVWTGTEFEQSVTEPIAWCEIPTFTE